MPRHEIMIRVKLSCYQTAERDSRGRPATEWRKPRLAAVFRWLSREGRVARLHGVCVCVCVCVCVSMHPYILNWWFLHSFGVFSFFIYIGVLSTLVPFNSRPLRPFFSLFLYGVDEIWREYIRGSGSVAVIGQRGREA